MIIKVILAGITAYVITALVCEFFKYKARRDDDYGGDGSFTCPHCKNQLTFRDTITMVKCPKCQRYF